MVDRHALLVALLGWIALGFEASGQDSTCPQASLAEVTAARRDLWGEAAMVCPNGPSYEFFRDLLPPPRYVHADFHYYPLVLSPPRSTVKARLISNGSGLNLQGGSRSWKDIGVPITFRVGPDEFRFGELRDRVSHPTLAEGYLPIYTVEYRHPYPVQSEGAVPLKQLPTKRPEEIYRLEAFIDTSAEHQADGLVWVRFSLAAGTQGIISLDVDAEGVEFQDHGLIGTEGKLIVAADDQWKWSRGLLAARLTPDKTAVVAIATKPLTRERHLRISTDLFEQRREAASQLWKKLLPKGMQVEVPEPIVQNAWRNLVFQNFGLINGDRLFYSAGNQYEQLYEAEGSDAALAMLHWGHESLVAELLPPLLDFKRTGLESHIASLKVQDIVQYYRLTRDTERIKLWRPRWQPALDRLLSARSPETGLLPKERYCGDISTPVSSLSVDAKAWRALYEMPAVLRAIGDAAAADNCERAASDFKQTLDTAVTKSIRHETSPPFVPIALLDDESVHDPITEVRIGSYWNIIMPYVIGSRIFKPGSTEETWIPHYIEQHGGLCMGMTRAGGTAHGFWTGPDRVNPLYGNRYVADVLRRDDVDRGLTSFYGMLAQGFTRNTFIAGEGCTLKPVDEDGRFFYCPPNSAGNGHFLTMLRNLLVQDWDLDDDGEPETLRLAAATPRVWLEHGKRIVVRSAPTSFGLIDYQTESLIDNGLVNVTVTLREQVSPAGDYPLPSVFKLRCRVPAGYEVTGALVGKDSRKCDASGTVVLESRRGDQHVQFSVRKVPAGR